MNNSLKHQDIETLVSGLCYKYHLGKEDREDIISNVFVKYLEHKNPQQLSLGWFSVVAKNEIIDLKRRLNTNHKKLIEYGLQTQVIEDQFYVGAEEPKLIDEFLENFFQGVKIASTPLQYKRFKAYSQLGHEGQSKLISKGGAPQDSIRQLANVYQCSSSSFFKSVKEARERGVTGSIIYSGLHKNEFIFEDRFSKLQPDNERAYKTFSQIISNNVFSIKEIEDSMTWLWETARKKLVTHYKNHRHESMDFNSIRTCFLIFRLAARYGTSLFQQHYLDTARELEKIKVVDNPVLNRELSVVAGYVKHPQRTYEFLELDECSDIHASSLFYFVLPWLNDAFPYQALVNGHRSNLFQFLRNQGQVGKATVALLKYFKSAICDNAYYSAGSIETVLSWAKFAVRVEKNNAGTLSFKDLTSTLKTLEINRFRVSCSGGKAYDQTMNEIFKLLRFSY